MQKRLEINCRPKRTELLPGVPSFQYGRFVHVIRDPEARVVNGKDRPQGCIPDNPSGKRTPLSSIISGTTRRMDTVLVPPIRTLHHTLCVYKGDQANSSIPTTVGNPSNYLSRRFNTVCPKHNTVVTRSVNSLTAVHCFGVSNQLSQEYNAPHPEVGVPGLCGRHENNEDCITTSQDRGNSEGVLPIALSRKNTNKDIGALHWDSCANQTSGASRPPSLSSLVGLENSGPDLSSGHLPVLSSPITRSTDESTVVDNPTTTKFIHKYFEDRGLYCHRIGCFQVGLGSSLSGSTHRREMDLLRIGLPYQLPGAERSFFSSTIFCEGDEQYRGSGKNGQQNSHSLCQQDGRPHDVPTMPLSITNLGVVSGSQHHPPCGVLTWQGQYQGRLGIPPSTGQQRLETVTIGIQIPQQLSRSFYYRPVCQQDQCSVTTILQLETRPSSQSSRCLFSLLDTGQTIPVPTFQSHRESFNQDSSRSDRICLSHSSSLASTSLVSTVAEVTGEKPNPPSCQTGSSPESRSDFTSSIGGGPNVPSRMAHLRQGFTVQGFSERVTNSLSNPGGNIHTQHTVQLMSKFTKNSSNASGLEKI